MAEQPPLMSEDDRSDQLALAHRQSGWMLVFTLSLIAFLIYAALAQVTGGGGLFLIIILMPLPFSILVVRGYFRRDAWALPWVMLVWILAIFICFLLMVIELSAALAGDSWAMVQGGLLLFLCWSMSQRLKMLRHPLFRAWYDGFAPALGTEIALQENEVLASCPHCQSLLAIQPQRLQSDDECPNCGQRLVSVATVACFSEEE